MDLHILIFPNPWFLRFMDFPRFPHYLDLVSSLLSLQQSLIIRLSLQEEFDQ